VGDENAGQAIDAWPTLAADGAEQAGEIAGTAVQRQYAKRRDDRRQRQRHGEELQDEGAAEETRMPRQGARHEQRRDHRKQGREDCLPKREAHDAQQVGIEGRPGSRKIMGAFDEQARECAADQQRDRGERDDAGADA